MTKLSRFFVYLTALGLLAASPIATAASGPIWLKLGGGGCDMAKLYVSGNILFGTEVGCANAAGQIYAGVLDVISGSVFLSVTSGTTTRNQSQGLWQLFPGLGTSYLIYVDTSVFRTIGPFNFQVYVTKPPEAIN